MEEDEGWECLNCGFRNAEDEKIECIKCHLDKFTAMMMEVKNKKKYCPDCGHRHKYKIYCHCFSPGIPDAELVAVSKSGWACAECGCVFLGRVEAGTAYPDRFSPVGRNGPCEVDVDCICHAAPLQRRVR